MKPWRAVISAMTLGTVVLLGACGSSSTSSKATATTTPGVSTLSTSPSAPVTTAAAVSGAALGVATNSKIGQQIVVDASGRTVYLYVPNGTSTTSKVPAAIKANWPPVTASGTPAAGSGLDQAKLALETQPDGTQQVSYAGHLLYRFVGDAAPGDANGQGLGGIWFVVSPAGDKMG